MAAQFVLEALPAGEVGQAVAGGEIAADLVGALVGQVPPLGARHRGNVGKDIGAQRKIAVVGEAPVIFAAHLQPVDLTDANIGDEKAAFGIAVGAQREAGQGQDARAEQLQHRAVEAHPLGLLVEDHLVGGDPPAGVLAAAVFARHRAGRIGRVGEQRDAILAAGRRAGGQPAPGAQGDQQVGHGPGFEGLGQFDLIGEQLVAGIVDQPDIAGGDDFAGGAVPRHFICAHRAVVRAQDDIAARGNGLALAVIGDLARFEIDDGRGFLRGCYGSRGIVLSGVLCGKAGGHRQQHQRQRQT